jgi:hypothetical protein
LRIGLLLQFIQSFASAFLRSISISEKSRDHETIMIKEEDCEKRYVCGREKKTRRTVSEIGI